MTNIGLKNLISIIVVGGALFALFVFAASNISTTNHWAWNDVIGWIDFCDASGGVCLGNVSVFNDRLEGYANSEAVGDIALNCNSTPLGPTCSTIDFKVSNNGLGTLSGYAWNDVLGWISFSGSEGGVVYGVTIDSATGDFSGFAWSEIAGWISFNCGNDFDNVAPGVQPQCSGQGGYDYKVNTSWRPGAYSAGELISSVFDTGVGEGAALNSIIWQGSQPAGTNVKFQIASSDSSGGPWVYVGPNNSTTDFYLSTGPGISIILDKTDHYNKKYFRYKIRLESNAGGTAAPQVEDIIINWSQ